MYATSTRPELAKGMGFRGAKIPLPYGPPDGDEGMRANVEHVKRARAAVGADFPLMLDCYMALSAPYAIELVRRIDREVPGGVKWLEEALPPDDYAGLARFARRSAT
jgi:L-rhamnonate dehydratase